MKRALYSCLIALLAVLPAHAAITLVAHTAGHGNSSTFTTSAIDTTGATAIVVNVSCAGIFQLTDSKGNVWSATGSYAASPLWNVLFYAANPVVGTGHTFTIASPFCSAEVAAFSGVTGVLPMDKYLTGTGTGTSAQPGSITPTNANSVVVAGIGTPSSGTIAISAIDSGFTITDTVNAGAGVTEGGGLAYLVQTSATAENPTWTLTSCTWNATNIVLISGSATPPVSPALIAHTSMKFTTTATTSAINTTGATLCVVNQSGFASVGTISDSNMNTWTALTLRTAAGSVEQRMFYAANCTGGAGHTFTVTGGNVGSLEVLVFSGTKTSSVFDTEAGSGTGARVVSFQAGSVTPANAKSIVVMGIGIENGNILPGSLYGIDQPFTVGDTNDPDGGHIGGSVAYYVQTSAVTMNPFWYLTQSNNVAGTNAVFIAQPPAGVSVPRHHGGTFQ